MCPVVFYWVQWQGQLRCRSCSGCVLSSSTEYSDKVNSGVDLVPVVSCRLLLYEYKDKVNSGVDPIPAVSCRLLLHEYNDEVNSGVDLVPAVSCRLLLYEYCDKVNSGAGLVPAVVCYWVRFPVRFLFVNFAISHMIRSLPPPPPPPSHLDFLTNSQWQRIQY